MLSKNGKFSHLSNSILALHIFVIQNIITVLLQHRDCKWKVSCMYCKNTTDHVYQTQCQSATHQVQHIQWPLDTSDLILTLSRVPVAWIYCPVVYIILTFFLIQICIYERFFIIIIDALSRLIRFICFPHYKLLQILPKDHITLKQTKH